MQSETFGREMWGGGIDEKEPSNPFLQKRSLRVPWHGRPPSPAQGHSPTNVLQAGCSGPHGVPRLNG